MKRLIQSILMLFILTIITGVFYPLLITLATRIFFTNKADGSMITQNGKVIGSELIGQSFSRNDYFHSRPSATNYDAENSGGYNYGPSNPKLLYMVESTSRSYRLENQLSDNVNIPSDAVTASGSGLDPHISFDNAMLQVKRISISRKLDYHSIEQLIKSNCEYPYGSLGTPVLNVVKLNKALDQLKSE